MAFPQCYQAYAKEKGRLCLWVLQVHTFPKSFSSQLLQTKIRHFWEDEDLFPGQYPAAIRSCGPKATLASRQVPGMGPFCVSPRLGTELPSSPSSHSLEPMGNEVFFPPWKRTLHFSNPSHKASYPGSIVAGRTILQAG